MLHLHILISATRELNEIETVGLEDLADFLRVVRGDAFFLPLDAVELDAEDEGGGAAFADFFSDFRDDAAPVGDAAAVFVGAAVGGFGEELRKEVAFSRSILIHCRKF
jgi:hypothetical protein